VVGPRGLLGDVLAVARRGRDAVGDRPGLEHPFRRLLGRVVGGGGGGEAVGFAEGLGVLVPGKVGKGGVLRRSSRGCDGCCCASRSRGRSLSRCFR
jgi:hypothetical protein